jgi:DNA-binding transcriptional LysR family regulator
MLTLCFSMETIKTLSALSVFQKVAHHQSFSKAADELSVSKAHVSKLIQSLERDYGEALFYRSTRKVSLTVAGDSLLRQCLGPLTELAGISENIKRTRQTPKGSLRVTVAGAFGEEIIAPLIFELIALYPELKIELAFSTRNVDLIDDSFDIAIRVGELSNSKLIGRKISTRKEYLCASKAYLNKFGVPASPQELSDHQCLIGATDTWSILEKNQIKRVKLSGRFKSDNARVLVKAAMAGLGIVKLPDVYVDKYLSSGKLVSVLEKFMPSEIPIWALSHSKKIDSINVKVFLEMLEKKLSV